MPLYEYQCDKCEKVLEVMQKFSDASLESCPDCNAPVKKLMSLGSFALKGSGWYTSDYKRSGASTGKPSSETSSKPAATPVPVVAAAPAKSSSSDA